MAEVIDSYRNEEWTQPFYAFVFDHQDAESGYYSTFFMSEDGVSLAAWRLAQYEPGGANEHLGTPVDWHTLRPETLDRFFGWLAINRE